MITPMKKGISRRGFMLASAAGAATLAMPGITFAQDKRLVLAVWGGPAAEAMKKVYGEAFADGGVAKLVFDESGPEAAKIRSMVESGQVAWDIADVSVADSILLGKAGFVRPVDYSIIDKNAVLPGFSYEYGIASYLFSSIMAFDKAALGGTVPTNWSEFWDVRTFPGKRTMRKHIEGVLEAALLADGVPPDQVYPIDEERAFAKLSELLPEIIFWNSGSESQQLMRDGEVTMGNVWSTRATQLLNEEPDRFALDFNGGLLLPGAWAVMENNPAGDAAFEAIAKMLDPEVQAKVFAASNLSPSVPGAEQFLDPALAAINPSSAENVAKQVPVDVQWYIDNQERVQTRFLELISA